MRIVVVGATRNFFKVGHATFRVLDREQPEIPLRLGIPDIVDAGRAVDDLNVELVPWDPHDDGSLDAVLRDCTRMLMVPPIDGRVPISRRYIEGASRAGIEYILCLGIQHTGDTCTMSRDVGEVDEMLAASGIAFDTLRLPVFLENLLYQIPSIAEAGEFRFPVGADAQFTYLTCGDLGEVFARILTDPSPGSLGDTLWTSTQSIACWELADALSQATGRKVQFRSQARSTFVERLIEKGMNEHAAVAVLELWDLVDRGRDPQPTSTFAELLGRTPTSVSGWCAEHACCFTTGTWSTCGHPKPPVDHMF